MGKRRKGEACNNKRHGREAGLWEGVSEVRTVPLPANYWVRYSRGSRSAAGQRQAQPGHPWNSLCREKPPLRGKFLALQQCDAGAGDAGMHVSRVCGGAFAEQHRAACRSYGYVSVGWLCSLAPVSAAELPAGSPPLVGMGVFCGLCQGRAKWHIPGM